MYRFGHCSGDLQDVYIDDCDDESFVASCPLVETLDGDPMEDNSSSLKGTVNMDPGLTGSVKEDPSMTETVNTDPKGHSELITGAGWELQNHAWLLGMSSKEQDDRNQVWGPLMAGNTEDSHVAWSASGTLVGMKRYSEPSDSGYCVGVEGNSSRHKGSARFLTSEDSGRNSTVFDTFTAPALESLDTTTRAEHITSGCVSTSTVDNSFGQEKATVHGGGHHLVDPMKENRNVSQRSLELPAWQQRSFEPTRQLERVTQSSAQKQMPMSSPTQRRDSLKSPANVQTYLKPTKQLNRSVELTSQLQRSLEPTSKLQRSLEPTTQVQRSEQFTIQLQRSLEPMSQLKRSQKPTTQLQRFLEPTSQLQRSLEPMSQLQRSQEPTTQLQRSMEPMSQLQRSQEPTTQLQRSLEPTSQPQRSLEPTTQLQRSLEPTSQPQRSLEPTTQLLGSLETPKLPQGVFESPAQLHRFVASPTQLERSLELTAQQQGRSSNTPVNLPTASDTAAPELHTPSLKMADESHDSFDLDNSFSSLDSGSCWFLKQKLTLFETCGSDDPACRPREFRRGAEGSQSWSTERRICVPASEAQAVPRAQPSSLSTLSSALSFDVTQDNLTNISTVHEEATALPELTLSRQTRHQSWQYGMFLNGQASQLSSDCRPESPAAVKPKMSDKGAQSCLSSTTQSESHPPLFWARPVSQVSSAPHQARSALIQSRDAPHQSRSALFLSQGDTHQAVGASHQASSAPHQASSAPHQARSALQSQGAPHQSRSALLQSQGDTHQAVSAPHQASSAPHQLRSALLQSQGDTYQAFSAPHRARSAPHQSKSSFLQSQGDTHQASSAPHQSRSALLQSQGSTHQAISTRNQATSASHQATSASPQSGFAPYQTSSTPTQSSYAPHQISSVPPQSSYAPPQSSCAPHQISDAPPQSSSALHQFSCAPQQLPKWTSPSEDVELEASPHASSPIGTDPQDQSGIRTGSRMPSRLLSQSGSSGSGGSRMRPDYKLQQSADSTVSSDTYPPLHSLLAGIHLSPPEQEQAWREVDMDKELFVATALMKEAWGALQDHCIVLLTGLPYSGKTTLARALLRRAEVRKWSCCTVTNFSEWRKLVGSGQGKIILLDEVFGRRVLKKGEVDSWRQSLEGMLKWCREGTLQLVFTFCPHVLQALRQVLPNFDLFSLGHEVYMGSLEHKEKETMIYQILQNKVHLHVQILVAKARRYQLWDTQGESHAYMTEEGSEEKRDWPKLLTNFILRIDRSGAMFPECCQRFANTLNMYNPLSDPTGDEAHFNHYLESAIKIFSRPSPLYKEFVSHLFLEQDVSTREKMQAVFCLLLAGLNVSDVNNAVLIMNTCQNLGFRSSFSPVGLQEMLMTWRITLVKEDCAKFINRHAYEGTALALAENIPISVVKAVDWPFLVKRCRVPMENSKKSGLDDILKPFELEIKRVGSDRKDLRPEYRALLERIAEGLKDPCNMLFAVQHSTLLSHDLVSDLKSFYESKGQNVDMVVFSKNYDSTYNMPLLYWALFNSDLFLFEWIFKTVMKEHGNFRKEDLVMAAYACCVLSDKAAFLELLLRYWQNAALEKVHVLLDGEHLKRQSPLRLHLPKADMCLIPCWKDQLKHINYVLRSSAHSSLAGNSRSVRQTAKPTTKGLDVTQLPLPLARQFKNQEVVELLSQVF